MHCLKDMTLKSAEMKFFSQSDRAFKWLQAWTVQAPKWVLVP